MARTEHTGIFKRYIFFHFGARVGTAIGRNILEARKAVRGLRFTSYRATHLEDN